VSILGIFYNYLLDTEPLHVAGYVEGLAGELAPASVKQDLATVRRFWKYLSGPGALPRSGR